MSFSRKFGDKYGKKLMDTATKTGIDAAKTASKRVVQKTAEATGDLIGNKIADKITSIGKPKEKGKTKETEEIYNPPEKDNRLLMTIGCFEHKMWYHCIKMEESQKIFSIQPLMIKIYQDLLLKNGFKFMINQEEIAMLTEKLESKHQC